MLRRRLLALALAAGLAVAATAAVALAAGSYKGDAQGIALTAAQAKFKALTSSGVAPKPPADKRQGYRSGWQVSYLKGTPAKPVQALALIYVYATENDAKVAYVSSCKGCSRDIQVKSVLMKYQATKAKPPRVIEIATCRNVYVATVVSGNVSLNRLGQDAASLAGLVFAKAAAGGMSACT